jgi:7,8-dihydroneopterin aldolase/epimerase/oxygenase
MDCIAIKDLEVKASVGVTEAERAQPQRLLVTVEMERDLAEAGRSDRESATTRYDVVANLVREVAAERPRKLVEAVAEDIAGAILSRRLADAVTIEVKKFSVPHSQYVSVQIRRALMIVLMCLAGFALADSIRLKTGESYDGTIVNETDTTLSIEMERAGGSILSTETINKDQIAEIGRATPEELAQRAMERAYANTRKYKLDPLTSYSPDFYRSVIDGVLRRFLADYPTSPYTNVVQAALSEWIAEQGTVASGMGKNNGTWMTAAEAAKRNAEAQARAAFDRSRMLMSQGQFAAAIEQLKVVLARSRSPSDLLEARQLTLDATRRWAEALEGQRTILNQDIKRTEDAIAKAQAARSAAESRVGGEIQHFGADPYVVRARNDLRIAEARMTQLRSTLAALDSQIADVRSRVAGATTAAGTNQVASAGPSAKGETSGLAATPTLETATAGSAPQRDVVDQVGGLFRQYWVIAVAVVVGMLWLCVHIFTRD